MSNDSSFAGKINKNLYDKVGGNGDGVRKVFQNAMSFNNIINLIRNL